MYNAYCSGGGTTRNEKSVKNEKMNVKDEKMNHVKDHEKMNAKDHDEKMNEENVLYVKDESNKAGSSMIQFADLVREYDLFAFDMNVVYWGPDDEVEKKEFPVLENWFLAARAQTPILTNC